MLGLILVFVLTTTPAPAQSESDQLRSKRLVLFGASWCAPCMAEYRTLPALIAAAAPNRIVLAWIDRPPRPDPSFAGNFEILGPQEARGLAKSLLGEGFGLPTTVLLDGSAKPCAIRRAPLHLSDILAMAFACKSKPG